MTNPIIRYTIADFWGLVEKTESCWLWRGATDYRPGKKTIYGMFGYQNESHRAHRFSYQLLVGEIPKGLTLDHLCRNTLCVNPEHLEPVTNRENLMRGFGACAMNARKTHCKRGHEFTPENTWVNADGEHRTCRTCTKLRNARRYTAKTQEEKRTP